MIPSGVDQFAFIFAFCDFFIDAFFVKRLILVLVPLHNTDRTQRNREYDENDADGFHGCPPLVGVVFLVGFG